MKAIEAYGICKSFNATKALEDISLSIDEAEIFGLIGPDGAGKTSLFRILTTLSLPQGSERGEKLTSAACSPSAQYAPSSR